MRTSKLLMVSITSIFCMYTIWETLGFDSPISAVIKFILYACWSSCLIFRSLMSYVRFVQYHFQKILHTDHFFFFGIHCSLLKHFNFKQNELNICPFIYNVLWNNIFYDYYHCCIVVSIYMHAYSTI